MADGTTTGTFPYEPNPSLRAMVWIQTRVNPATDEKKDNKTALQDIINKGLEQMPATDMGPTNDVLGQILAKLDTLLKQGQSVNVGNLPANQAVSGPAAQAAAAGTGFGGVASGAFGLIATPTPITVAALANTSATKSLAIRIIPVTVGTLTAVTRTRYKTTAIGGTAVATPNLSGGTATPAGKLYAAPTGVPASGGLVERTTLIGPGMPDPPPAEGWLVLKPGEAYVWTAQATGSLLAVAALLATVYVAPEWWEV